MADPLGITAFLLATASLARQTYKKCRDSPGQYQTLCGEANSLRAILEDLHELAEQHVFTGYNRDELWDRTTQCRAVLEELDAAVDRFRGLGQQRRVVDWDGLRWDPAAVTELRSRLTANVTLLSNFFNQLTLSSQIRVEKALYTLLEQIQTGRRSAKSVSRLTTTNGEDEAIVWPDVAGDLEDVGLDRDTAEQNRPFIVDWLFQKLSGYIFPDTQPNPAEEVAPKSDATYNETVPKVESPNKPSSSTHEHAPSLSTTHDGSGSPPGSFSVPYNYPPQDQSAASFQLRYMEPFGEDGDEVAEDVRKKKNTFKDDLNRAREYWKRENWAEVKKYLLRVLVAAQLPKHKRTDISARTAAFLLGVAYKNSGDLEMAKSVMISILAPIDRSGDSGVQDPTIGPYDDGQIAAATWLGDLCLKTNLIESAAFAWALAYDAALRRTQMRERTVSVPDSPINLTASSPPPLPLTRVHTDRALSGPQPAPWPQSHSRALLFRLAFTDRHTRNLDALRETLNSGWDPDGDDSIFTESRFISKPQMCRITEQALHAIERADASVLADRNRSKEAHMRLELVPAMYQVEPQASTAGRAERNAISGSIIAAEDYLQSPVRSTQWPLECDVDFALPSAIRVIDWFFTFTLLEREGVLYNIPVSDMKIFREHKPTAIVENFDLKQSQRLVETLHKLIDSVGFEFREEPGSFRCRNGTDKWSRFPKVACFAIRIVKYRSENILTRSTKLCAYLSDVVFWNGEIDEKTAERLETKSMLQEMRLKIKLYDAVERGVLLPDTRSNVAATN